MREWRIYYDDGSTFDDSQGTPEAAPAFGVLFIVFPDREVGRVVMRGWDWYYFDAETRQWWGSDIHGLLDGLLHDLPRKAYKQGRNVDNKRFRDIMKRAMNDADFPVKSAKRHGEHP